MNTHSKSDSHKSVKASSRAADRWCVAPSKVVVRDLDDAQSGSVSLGAVASETPRAPLGRRHKLAMELASLAAEEGLDAAFEAIERGLMGMSVLPDDADVREDLRELSESIDIAAERLGLRGGHERG